MNNFRDRLIHILQTTGQLEGRADDVADAIISEFSFVEERYWHRDLLEGGTSTAVIGWVSQDSKTV